MKRITPYLMFIAAILTVSCSKKVPDTVNHIPDHAFIVASMNPMEIHEKGQVGSMEHLLGKIDNPVVRRILKDPVTSGLDIDKYMFMFIYFHDDEPVVGITSLLDDAPKFAENVELLDIGDDMEIIEHKGYSMITPDGGEFAMAWTEKKLIMLASPDLNLSAGEWQEELVGLYDLSREEAVTSIVDFNDFTKKMKDLNVWFTGDELVKVLEETGVTAEMDMQLPVDLSNNYGQMFMEFKDGAMYAHAETHFSDDVTKAAETFLVAKEELNEDLLELAPGNDLLMAMAFSVDLEKMRRLMKNFSPPEMDSVSGRVEKITGIPGEQFLDAMNGDFVISVNSAAEGAAIPVEVMIGIGLDDKTLQDKLMGRVNNMADVEQEGDFFMIKTNGMELYSGIVNNIWVITNTPGYKDAVTGPGLEKNLGDSKFKDFAGGSMGMYMNLDFNSYPSALQGMLARQGDREILNMVVSAFQYMGIEASNKENDMILKTASDEENSLYSILKILDTAAGMND